MQRFASNYIKTTKYNALSYLPLSLLYQFKRFANIYFLLISILSFFPSISPFSALSSTLPFAFVVMVSVFREGVEDLARYKQDREINRVKVQKVNNDGNLVEIYSSSVQVGDILYIPEDTMFASDMILLDSSSEGGQCFIQTSSLDGEKNLKKRLKPKDFLFKNQNEKDSARKDKQSLKGGKFPVFKGRCECDLPNAELYEFSGNLKYEKRSYALSATQLLLKGSILKNTEWIIGFVVYTGNETKLMMNSKEGTFKTSKVEAKMNQLVILVLGIQIFLCLLVSFVGINWYRNDSSDYKYLQLTDALGTSFVETFFRYFLLLNTLIPISLIVTIEVVKTVQAYFITNDAEMYSLERDRPAKVSSASLNEELGQIGYIFSDKTGTLTRNIMEFKLCQIGQQLYGDANLLEYDTKPLQQKVLRYNQKQGTQYTFKNKQIENVLFRENITEESSTMCDFKVMSKSRKIVYKIMHQQILVVEFLKLLSAAHQCMPETKKSNGMEEIFYQGPSPDEVTLVEFAQQHGYEFYFGNDNFAKVRVQKPAKRSPSDQVTQWQKIRNIEFDVYRRMDFNSDRKRMSILLKDPDDGYYKLYVKGADSIIKDRLDKKQLDKEYMEEIDDFLTRASVKGYRTLLMAMKVLDEDEVKTFLEDCGKAEQNLLTKDQQLQQIYNDFERDLVIVGATCVEDRLQDKVPETIRDLQNAGIKIWMLTGDKLETAENIGYSCNLLRREMHIIKCSNLDDVKREFNDEKGQINEQMQRDQIPRGILIEAGALKNILEDDSFTIKRHFLKISKTCEAVICCRVSPAQKADVVKLIKDDDPKTVTLAIGDGANDVSMILEAHIGIGLYGNEGMRAVQSGDYALGEFKYLWRLILIHGRLAYIRNCDLILYFFYKNIVFTLPQVFYAFIAAYSGQTIYDDWYITFYNLFFTSLPLMIVTFRLMTTSRYFTWINLVSIYILSLGVYVAYMWGSNYTGFSNTYLSMVTIFQSPHYYLTVFLCVGFCYLTDLFIEAWKFEITTNPTDFLRKIISNGKDIDKHLDEFNRIYLGIKTQYVDKDIEREGKIEERRDLRVNKYGPNKFKDFKKKEVKKQIKNEIELEFIEQDEKDKYINSKYNKESDDEEEQGYTSPDLYAHKNTANTKPRMLQVIEEAEKQRVRKKFEEYKYNAEKVKANQEKKVDNTYYRIGQQNQRSFRQPSQSESSFKQMNVIQKGETLTNSDQQTYGQRFKNQRANLQSDQISNLNNQNHLKENTSQSQSSINQRSISKKSQSKYEIEESDDEASDRHKRKKIQKF
ncbi:phospholipid-translocating p-type flippase family [Stylonychia lemnae]|uniref:Phospholipid-transporting ATPase n=1 Tax=Stylonychia lemnae TaxID=5949 RepID=A0A078A8Z3_STYLE|nr:phospholipid-translocating p-type flippase family [Stylonychia lemnae]|eukprot:CDW77273.1 phospholipid-translocating p-type flippase family [Stylonychia lemnae]